MALEAVFERFAKKSPLTVMARLLMQQALSREWLEEVFERHRDTRVRREAEAGGCAHEGAADTVGGGLPGTRAGWQPPGGE